MNSNTFEKLFETQALVGSGFGVRVMDPWPYPPGVTTLPIAQGEQDNLDPGPWETDPAMPVCKSMKNLSPLRWKLRREKERRARKARKKNRR